jgi:hypothetical protein
VYWQIGKMLRVAALCNSERGDAEAGCIMCLQIEKMLKQQQVWRQRVVGLVLAGVLVVGTALLWPGEPSIPQNQKNLII